MSIILIGFFYFIPIFIIGWNAWKIISYYQRTKKFIRVKARVVNITITKASALGTSGGKSRYFSPVIEFTDIKGEKHTLEYTEDNPDRSLYKIGEEIDICYAPNEPRRFMVYDPKAEYLVAGVWILVGLAVMYLMLFFDWNSKPPM